MERKKISELTKKEQKQFQKKMVKKFDKNFVEYKLTEDDYQRNIKDSNLEITNLILADMIHVALEEKKEVRINIQEGVLFIEQ